MELSWMENEVDGPVSVGGGRTSGYRILGDSTEVIEGRWTREPLLPDSTGSAAWSSRSDEKDHGHEAGSGGRRPRRAGPSGAHSARLGRVTVGNRRASVVLRVYDA